MAKGSTQPLTEMSTRNILWGIKVVSAYSCQPYHLHVPSVLKSGSLNLLEACPSLYRGCCVFIHQVSYYKTNCSFHNTTKKISILTLNFNIKLASKYAKAWKYSILNSYRNSQRDATVYQNFLLFHVYIKLNMFRTTHHPSSGAQNCTSSLWFCIREKLSDNVVDGCCQRPATSTSKQPFTYAKPETASAVLSS
jgi:hypothetical protein